MNNITDNRETDLLETRQWLSFKTDNMSKNYE